jgi:hypothetical protein
MQGIAYGSIVALRSGSFSDSLFIKGFRLLECGHAKKLFQNRLEKHPETQRIFFHKHCRAGDRDGLHTAHPALDPR